MTQQSRRHLPSVVIVLQLCTAGLLFFAASAWGEGLSPEKRARLKAASKQRRIIFNDDSEELACPQGGTVEGFLSVRLGPLVGTQVDTISWSVLGICGDAPVYDSRIQPIFGEAHGGVQPGYPHYVPNLRTLVKAGHCPLKLVTDFAHQHGMESFACIRMNDCHDSFIPGMKTLWKRAHPEFLVGSDAVPDHKNKHPLGLYVTAQDYSHRAVRDRKFEIIEEVCKRYDIEGIELNYIRHPVFFSRTMRGLPVTAEEAAIMTSLMRRIRGSTDAIASGRGRPILVAAVVPDSFRLAMNVGLDLRTWMEEDLVDILIPGLGYAPFTLPVGEFTEAARPHGVRVYPCINRIAPQHFGPDAQGLSDEVILRGFRAVASNWYQAGADGIYFWNLAVPFLNKTGQDLIETRKRYYACLTDVGDPKTLNGKAKLFSTDNPVLGYYLHISGTPPLPVDLAPGEIRRLPLVVGDDLEAAARNGSLACLELKLHLSGPVDDGLLTLQINGKSPIGGELEKDDAQESEHYMTYLVEPSSIRRGRNVIQVSTEGKKLAVERPVVLRGIQLLVLYRP